MSGDWLRGATAQRRCSVSEQRTWFEKGRQTARCMSANAPRSRTGSGGRLGALPRGRASRGARSWALGMGCTTREGPFDEDLGGWEPSTHESRAQLEEPSAPWWPTWAGAPGP